MSTSRDIESLFNRFGGDAGRYHEVRAEADAEKARVRWPLLGGVELRENEAPGQPDDGPSENGQSVNAIAMTNPPVAVMPDADSRDQPVCLLKKLAGGPAPADSQGTQAPSEPLVRIFERLRAGERGERPTMPSAWTSRS
ncbi:cellulose biosynthesis protein BcsP [Burkholderia anthina]|uniref:cellulose biosynthesis protein BcsP n=1 Tax=Burkholderia anthina TaxID=179879 RepID=UPI003C7BC46C